MIIDACVLCVCYSAPTAKTRRNRRGTANGGLHLPENRTDTGPPVFFWYSIGRAGHGSGFCMHELPAKTAGHPVMEQR